MRLRYEAREVPEWTRGPDNAWKQKKGNWRVYDRDTGSFPYRRPDTGPVKQDTDQATAEAEANRLNGVP